MALNMMEETKAEALKMLEERKHQLEQDLEGVKIDTKIEMGDAAEVILETEKALNPDLIVMGSHGRKGISRLLMGSVAEVVFRHATCPVLLVKK
jgi:universal stress protein A